MQLEDPLLTSIHSNMLEYTKEVLSKKEFTFASINSIERIWNVIIGDFSNCKNISTRKLIKKVLVDRIMIVVYILLTALIIAAIVSNLAGL